jgi:hypothetical protein
MPRIDKKKFPNMVILMENEPDDMKIFIKGTSTPEIQEAPQVKKATLQTMGVDDFNEANMSTKIVTLSDFKEDHPDGRKRAVIKTPHTDIKRVYGYAKRENVEDETPINIEMFVTGKQKNPSGIWTYRFSMVRQQTTPSYVATQAVENNAVIQMASSVLGTFASAQTAALSVIQQDPKAIAAKFLAGPASVAVKGIIAFATEQYVKYKPLVQTVLSVSGLIQQAAGDPLGAAVSLFGYVLTGLKDEDLKDIVWFFRGGA